MSHAEIVEAWFREKIATGPVARDTPAYNQVFDAKADLVARLEAASAPEPVEKTPLPRQPAAKAASKE